MSSSFGKKFNSVIMVAFASAISFQVAVADDTQSIVEAPSDIQLVSTPVVQDDELVIGEEESAEPILDESEIVDSVPSESVAIDAPVSEEIIMGDIGTVVDSGCGCGVAAPAPIVMDSGCGCGAPVMDYNPCGQSYNPVVVDPYVQSMPTPVQPMPIQPMPIQPMPIQPGIVFSGNEGARPVMQSAPAMSAPAMVFVGDEGARPVMSARAYSVESAAPRRAGCFQKLRQRMQNRGSRGCNGCR